MFLRVYAIGVHISFSRSSWAISEKAWPAVGRYFRSSSGTVTTVGVVSDMHVRYRLRCHRSGNFRVTLPQHNFMLREIVHSDERGISESDMRLHFRPDPDHRSLKSSANSLSTTPL